MDLGLKDRVVLITGAGSGMGRAGAIVFAEQGARVVVSDIDDDGGQETVRQIETVGGQAFFVHCDVSNTADTDNFARAALERWGTIDVLYNNAAATVLCNTKDRAIDQLPEEIWDKQIDITLKGVYRCSKACLPTMLKNERGVILNVSSIDAMLAEPGFDSYTTAKGGVESLTRAMAANYGRRGIRVNCISPGYVITECQKDWFENEPEAVEAVLGLHLTSRLGQPEDIAAMAAFLASDRAAFVTGAVIPVDGGYTAFKDCGANVFCQKNDEKK